MTKPIVHKLWYMNFFAGKTRCEISLSPVLSSERSWTLDWADVTCKDCLHLKPKREKKEA